MLLGMEKKKSTGDEVDSKFSLRSELDHAEIDDERRGSHSDEFKDVDMVSSLSECSTSLDSTNPQNPSKSNNNPSSMLRNKILEDDSFDSESAASSTFEFHKDRCANRPFSSKPTPSKWDDAQKWIASPNNSNRSGRGSGAPAKKGERVGLGSRQPPTKIVMEIAEEEAAAETKRIDPSQGKREKSVNWEMDPLPESNSCANDALVAEDLAADSAVSLIQHDSSTPLQNATTCLNHPPTVRAVSMRDMGTEMTPIASQEPSRTGTPVRATTPARNSNSSRPSTPQQSSIVSASGNKNNNNSDNGDCSAKELSEKELQMRTRREIMILGTQLGKTNIAAWASKEEEEKDASLSLSDRSTKRAIETRAAAWEEAEKAKYLARFKREEIKIQAWENHQIAKTEARMRKIEVEIERMRAHAQESLMNKLATVRHKAEEKLATAEAERNEQAAKIAQQAEYIRRTGLFPSSCTCWGWCF
ncbi:Uncharacterized protein ACMD2_06296 [Ananas comosus]|uniref:Remorin C-terminal domain-containing protein n=1 Tax=Ananas comosus TaxID=4615 RepID=A0A199W2W6_ANACO|nr:Uncharacterized protein ACMD2_06296 [Ananas comosus]